MAGGESVWWRTQVFCHDEGDILIWWVIELSCFTESGGQSQRPQTYQWARHKKARWQGAIKQGSNQTSERYQSVLCPCVCVCVCVSVGERTCVCHIKQEMFVAAVGLVWTAITISGNSSQACGCDSAGGSLSAIASLPRSPPCTFCSSTLRPPPSSLTSSSLSPPHLLYFLSAASCPPVAPPPPFARWKLADIASVPPQLRLSRDWFSTLPAKLLQLHISFNPTSKSLFVKPWKQGVLVPLVWPCVALLQHCLEKASASSVLMLFGCLWWERHTVRMIKWHFNDSL